MTLKNKYNIVQLKHYTQRADDELKSTSNKDAGNFWNHAPDKIVEMILLYAVQQTQNSFPGHNCDIYASIKLMCCKLARIIDEKGLPYLQRYILIRGILLESPTTEKSL